MDSRSPRGLSTMKNRPVLLPELRLPPRIETKFATLGSLATISAALSCKSNMALNEMS